MALIPGYAKSDQIGIALGVDELLGAGLCKRPRPVRHAIAAHSFRSTTASRIRRWILSAMAMTPMLTVPAMARAPLPVGVFSDHLDIGKPAQAGSATYDAATRTYRVTGGGANMWADHDDFHFVWKKATGDVAMETELDFVTPSPKADAAGYIHRKGGLILRQDLDADSAYVDAVRMGNHQLSLQYRAVKGGQTRLIWINTTRQQALRLEKIGDYAYLSVPGTDGKLHRAGGSFRLKLTGPYYIGLAVCPHDDTTHETMAFKSLRIGRATAAAPRGMTLQTIQVANPAEQTALLHGAAVTVAGWSHDGGSVYARTATGLKRATAWDSDAVAAAAASEVRTGSPTQLRAEVTGALITRRSPDGRSVAVLTAVPNTQNVLLSVIPVTGGKPQQQSAVALSEFRGNATSLSADAWSPDNKTIAFVSAD